MNRLLEQFVSVLPLLGTLVAILGGLLGASWVLLGRRPELGAE